MPRPIVWLIYSLIFSVALILSTGLLNTIFPYSYAPKNLGDVGLKLQYFTEHKDEYDIIFLGPSTTYFGVIPKVFDDLITREGQTVKSFNFGISAANLSQIDFYLENILALEPAKLKWIFLDCAFDIFDTHFPTTPTELYWHTPGKTLENFRLILESHKNWQVKTIEIFANFKSFFYRELGIGQLSTLWQEKILGLYLLTSASSENKSPERLIQEAGYYSIEWLPNVDKWKSKFLGQGLENYKNQLKSEQSQPETNQQDWALNPSEKSYKLDLMKKIVSRFDRENSVGDRKIEPIFLIPPILESEINRTPIVEAYNLGYLQKVFAFNDPQNFKNLYRVDRRIDSVHLNHQGSQEFTSFLADRFSRYLKRTPEKLNDFTSL